MPHRWEGLPKAPKCCSGMGHIVRLVFGFLTLAVASLAEAQGNLDQGKTAAELYASDCATCHKSPQSVSSTKPFFGLEGFLSKHYTSSRESAAILAAYLKDEFEEGIPRPPADIPNVMQPLTSQPTTAQHTQSTARRGPPKATSPATNDPPVTPAPANNAAETVEPPATSGPAVTPAADNRAADTLAYPPANGQAATPAAGDSSADKSASPAANSAAHTVDPPAASRPSSGPIPLADIRL
jgi:hypothetical protein